MKTFIASRWFALADLGCAILCGGIWYLWPQAKGWPLVIALLPWFIRIITGHFPVRRTVFTVPLILFLLTAVVGIWAAYDQEAAWAKFWVIVGAVILFFALAEQPQENLWLVAGLLGLFGVIVSGAYLLGQDFQKQPADLEILNRIGIWWISIRPAFYRVTLSPNLVGGILSALIPFPLALGVTSWRDRHFGVGIFWWVSVLAVLLGLALTSSRGAWGALIIAIGAWSAYEFRAKAASLIRHTHWIWIPLALIPAALLLVFVFSRTGGILGLVDRLPGLPSAGSRYDLARNSLRLISDFPYTGGGLTAFAGLYSQYIMVIPVFLFGYSHNFFLDVAVEQGLPGLIALFVIYAGSVFRLFSGNLRARGSKNIDLLQGAVFAGLVVVGLHGLVDDALYGNLGTPLLFVLPAISCALTYPASVNRLTNYRSPGDDRRIIKKEKLALKVERKINRASVIGIGIFMVVGLLTILWKPLAASWYADLGAVKMARAELASFPSGSWELDRKQKIFEGSSGNLATADFNRSIQLNSGNTAARYRLGLISMYRGDFSAALFHLELAHQADPYHRGVIKVLGYCYVWEGKFDQALPLLTQIPEAGKEMDVYAWMWKARGSEEIADRSARAALMLSNAGTPNQK